jgi:hypothetical protein
MGTDRRVDGRADERTDRRTTTTPGRKLLVSSILAVCVVLAGCSGVGSLDRSGGDEAMTAPDVENGAAGSKPVSATAVADDAGTAESDLNADAQSVPAVRQRALVRTGEIRIRVEDYDTARRSVVTTVRDLGGFVSDAKQRRNRRGNDTWRTGYVVVRVPAEEFSTAVDAATSEGEVLSEATSARDVSEQLVDVEARLENLRRERDRLRTFLDAADDTEELLQVERRLSEVQGEIERLRARQRSLERRVAFSTLRVEIREPQPETARSTPTAFHQRPLTEAVAASTRMVVILARSSVVLGAYLAPFVAVVAVPLGVVVFWWRRRG